MYVIRKLLLLVLLCGSPAYTGTEARILSFKERMERSEAEGRMALAVSAAVGHLGMLQLNLRAYMIKDSQNLTKAEELCKENPFLYKHALFIMVPTFEKIFSIRRGHSKETLADIRTACAIVTQAINRVDFCAENEDLENIYIYLESLMKRRQPAALFGYVSAMCSVLTAIACKKAGLKSRCVELLTTRLAWLEGEEAACNLREDLLLCLSVLG